MWLGCCQVKKKNRKYEHCCCEGGNIVVEALPAFAQHFKPPHYHTLYGFYQKSVQLSTFWRGRRVSHLFHLPFSLFATQCLTEKKFVWKMKSREGGSGGVSPFDSLQPAFFPSTDPTAPSHLTTHFSRKPSRHGQFLNNCLPDR